MYDLKSMTLEELMLFITTLGQPKFRAKQLFNWLHAKQVTDFSAMTDLPKTLLEKLSQKTTLTVLTPTEHLVSQQDATRKLLFGLEDGHSIETAVLVYDYGYTVCISTQVGCKMGCTFCASGLNGFVRQLTPGEMLEQVYAVARIMGKPCHGVVLMGTGEPFDNYDNVLKWIALIGHPNGRNLGARQITVSTAGVVPKILEFAKTHPQVTLAISLHSVDQTIRAEIMPISKKYPVPLLLQACKSYVVTTNKRITFEYALIPSINDDAVHAHALAKALNKMLCHVNLIPINPVIEMPLPIQKDTVANSIHNFKKIIESYHIPVTIRRTLGSDIDAACGQLRLKHEKDQKKQP